MGDNRKLDLVLVNPGSRAQIYQSLGNELTAIEPPVWAGLIATFARKKGYSVAIVDLEAEDLSPEQAARRIENMDPLLTTVVVYGHQPSASTQNMTGASAICSAIKSNTPEMKVMLLGGHVATLPERTLREELCDFVTHDEGLFAVVELLEALRARSSDFSRVRGLVYRGVDGTRTNPAAPLLKDLDTEMPGIAWDLLPMDRYRAHNWHCFGRLQRAPYAAIYTTLGCPYHCSFCCIQAPFKAGEKERGMKEGANSYRFWNPQIVIKELETLVQDYGVRNVKFADEMFVLNPRHVGEICDLLIERDLGLNIWAYARVDTVKEGMIDKLKRAGFNWLAFGIEAASDRVRKDVDKRFDQEDVYKTIRAVQAAGINVIGNFVFGLPEDDLESMQETLDLAIDLNCEFGNFYSAMAYPGSPLYNLAVQQNWPLPSTWSGYSQHAYDTLPLPTRYLSASDVLRFRDHAFNVYFTNPKYLDMVRTRFGPDTVDHIRQMTAHKLDRKYA